MLIGDWETSEQKPDEVEEQQHSEFQILPEEEEVIPKEPLVLNISSLPPQNALKGTFYLVLIGMF